jgi:prepilin-type N-terminal cleavage/methylation domain-containing protein
MMPSKKTTLRAFTLIELLIVVAIIAILAAIAVPNFLEAQTRSKVSRVQADMRSMAVAVESYMVDNNNKLFYTIRVAPETRRWICSKLTTPIAYMTSIPNDPFNNVDANNDDRTLILWGMDYTWGPYSAGDACPYYPTYPAFQGPHGTIGESTAATFFSPYPQIVDPASPNRLARTKFWLLFSLGPDQKYAILDPSYPSAMVPYDPTNGTVSKGDVVRFKS